MQAQAEQGAQLNQLENIVKSRLERDALTRFGTIKAADPQKAEKLTLLLAQFIQRGVTKITDDDLKMLLNKMNDRKEFRITRK